jgi:hypothetical protein
LAEAQRPRITELYFEMMIDNSPAPDFQRVLWVLPKGNSAGAATSCSPDLGNRANGSGRLMRIYSTGARVALSVPAQAGGSAFDGWNVIGAPVDDIGLRMPSLQLKLDNHVFAFSHWARTGEAKGPTINLAALVGSAETANVVQQAPNRPNSGALKGRTSRSIGAPSTSRSIRIGPRADDTILGVIPPDGKPDILEEKQGWHLVNYEGVVGWVDDGAEI